MSEDFDGTVPAGATFVLGDCSLYSPLSKEVGTCKTVKATF